MTCHVFVCRDFVCIRQMEISGGSLYAASKTIVTALKPEQPGKVRSDRYYTYVCMYVCMYCMYVRMYECTYVRMYVYVCMCVYVYMYVCMYIRTYVCICTSN